MESYGQLTLTEETVRCARECEQRFNQPNLASKKMLEWACYAWLTEQELECTQPLFSTAEQTLCVKPELQVVIAANSLEAENEWLFPCGLKDQEPRHKALFGAYANGDCAFEGTVPKGVREDLLIVFCTADKHTVHFRALLTAKELYEFRLFGIPRNSRLARSHRAARYDQMRMAYVL